MLKARGRFSMDFLPSNSIETQLWDVLPDKKRAQGPNSLEQPHSQFPSRTFKKYPCALNPEKSSLKKISETV